MPAPQQRRTTAAHTFLSGVCVNGQAIYERLRSANAGRGATMVIDGPLPGALSTWSDSPALAAR